MVRTVLAEQRVAGTDATATILQVAVPALNQGQDRRPAALVAGTARTLVDAPSSPSPAAPAEPMIDRVHSYLGLRRAGVRRRPVPAQRPALLPADGARARATGRSRTWPRPAPTRCAREVELIKELGFNGVRMHQKVEDPRFLYWCDRLGLLVWGEMASALRLQHRRGVERVITRVDRGGAPRRQPPLHRDVGAAQRELGRARHRRTTQRQQHYADRAVPPDQGPRPAPDR